MINKWRISQDCICIMKKDFLTKRALDIQNKHDLLDLINDLAKIEKGKEAFSFSIGQLCFYSNPDLAVNTYRHFDIPKKSGGERHIAAPNNTLRCIQHYVNLIFRAVYKPSECATGFTEGKSIVDNALKHVGQNYVFNIDLKDFFTSITRIRIYKRLQLAPFFYNKPVASILAGLCCVRDATDKKRAKQYLPQGAPTSPIVTNMVCGELDYKLNKLARKYNLKYSRYADDITFSSMHNVYQENGELIITPYGIDESSITTFRGELEKIIIDEKFTINKHKTRLQKANSRQEVTGLVVNKKVNVTKYYIHGIRNLLNIWEKYGYDEALKAFLPHYYKHKKYVKGSPDMKNVIEGKLLYIRMVKGYDNPVYLALKTRFDKLVNSKHIK